MSDNPHYPLRWPDMWPRTPLHERKSHSAFKVSGDKARRDLIAELKKMGCTDVRVCSNVPVRNDGMPYADQARRRIDDPGVAVWFTRNGTTMAMARDKYQRPEDNLRDLGLAVRDMNALALHGGAIMMERAFSGFAALPPPLDWRRTLGFKPDQRVTRAEINTAHRRLALEHHPDVTGDHKKMADLNVARDKALGEVAD